MLSRIRIPELSVPAFAFLVSGFWLVAYDHRFWSAARAELWTPGFGSVLFLATVFGIVWVVQAAVILLMPGRIAPRVFTSLLFVLAAVGAYFTDTFGTLLNKDMMRNVFETDISEAGDLVTFRLIAYVLLLGVLPAVLLWRVPLKQRRWPREALSRVASVTAGLALFGFGAWMASASWASFLREHKSLRYLLNPVAVVAGTAGYLTSSPPAPLVLQDPGGEPTRTTPARGALATVGTARKPLLLFLVIGETARAANWQLNGYSRATTPQLARDPDVLYFRDTASCGTSTSASLPCIFSHLGRDGFHGTEARRYTNMLDMLVRAGIDVEWRDNNSGCKGICARVPTLNFFSDAARRTAALCPEDHCYDAVMDNGLEERLAHLDHDTLIVFHQNGSHGPAYFERYPRDREFFTPACHTKELDQCTPAQVVNAYDNSLRYTDEVLAGQIALLQRLSDRVHGALIYVSDHGESLGEGGLHLHGMPYSIAPATQKQVPLLMWLSPDYRAQARITLACLKSNAARGGASHDNLFSTVLGVLGVRNDVYRDGADLTAPCRPRQLQAKLEPGGDS